MVKPNFIGIISFLFIIFTFFLLFYIFYKSEIFHNGTLRGYYLKYYIISISLFFLSILFLFLRKDLKINISIILVSIVISLYLIESFFIINRIGGNWRDGTNERIKASKKLNKKFDSRSKYQFYQDFKKKFPNAVLFAGSNNLKVDNKIIRNFGGASLRQTVLCNENGYFATYKSDRYGFNNPDQEWEKKEIEYLVIGDSFVQGYCVYEKDTISGNLRNKTKNINGVINLGIAGTGPLSQHAILKEYTELINTKRIIWVYCDRNDLKDFYREKNIKILMNYFNKKEYTQNLIQKQSKIDEIIINSLSKKKEIYQFRFLKLYNLRIFLFGRLKNKFVNFINEKPLQPPSNEFESLFKKVKELSESRGAKLYFVYLPSYEDFIDNKNGKKNLNKKPKHYKKILKIIADQNIPIIDLHADFFEKQSDPSIFFPFELPGHLTENGYNQISRVIFNSIKKFENK